MPGPFCIQEVSLSTELFVPARSVFQDKVKPVPMAPGRNGLYVLKSAANNRKLSGPGGGTVFTKGPWIGMPLFSLALEERATCPLTCARWVDCYTNRSLNLIRYHHGPELLKAVERDVKVLAIQNPAGFVVRLHVAGDFWSVDYVKFWNRLVRKVPQLHIYGYTHRLWGTPIGDAVTRLVTMNQGRVSILRSDAVPGDDPLPRAMTIPKGSVTPHPLSKVVCPEQTGRTESCLSCGLCMSGKTSVSFINHGTIPHKLIQLGRAERVA